MDLTELERLARAADAAEDAVVAAAGQHREDLWSAHHAANRVFLEATAEMILPLIEVAKAARLSLHYHMGLAAITRSELNKFDAALSSALDALSPLPSEGKLRKDSLEE